MAMLWCIKLSGMTKGAEDAHNLEDVHYLEDAHCTDNLARSGEMQREKIAPILALNSLSLSAAFSNVARSRQDS